MSIAANRFPGIRAARCCNTKDVEMTRKHNDANILCVSADVDKDWCWIDEMVPAFINTETPKKD